MNDRPIQVAMTADPKLLAELKRHGVLFNQLLHAIHAGYPVDASRVETCIEALQGLIRREIERG